MRHANGNAHIHADSDCDSNRNIYCNSDRYGHIHANSDSDGNCRIHSNCDSYGNVYADCNGNGYAYTECYANCDCVAAFPVATATADTAGARGQQLLC